MVNPTTKNETVWRSIQKNIQQRITEGVYEAGCKLPTEHALAKEFEVNRHTIRRAMSTLADKGLIRIEQGRGMFVQENLLYYPVSKRTRFTESVERQNRSRGRKIISARTIKANAKIARNLSMLPGRAVIHIRSITEVDGKPINLSDDYFNKSKLPEMADYALETLSITESLKRCGIHDYFRKETRVMTRLPTREEANILKQLHTQPVLISESIDVDENNKSIGFGETLWAGARVRITLET